MFTVVVDVDDVLIDLNKSVEKKLQRKGYKDFSVNNIYTYDLNKSIDITQLPPSKQELVDNGLGCYRGYILDCYRDVDVFNTACICKNAINGMKVLASNFNVIINSLSCTSSICSYKLSLYDRYFNYPNVGCNLMVGVSKPIFSEAFAVFDDSIEELLRYSDNTIKILVDRPQNRELFNKNKLSQCKNLVRVKNFYNGVQFLVEKLKEEYNV